MRTIVKVPIMRWSSGLLVGGWVLASVAAAAAQTVTVAQTGTPRDVTVEWLRLDPSGVFEVASGRLYRAGPVHEVPVQPGTEFVRFTRPDAAPVTAAASDLLASRSFILPEPEAGGELVVVFETGVVLPSSLSVSGPRTTIRDRQGRAAMSVSGLPPGRYDIEPAYAGGLGGVRQTADVAAGESSVVVRRKEAVGGVRMTASPEVCAGSFSAVLMPAVEVPVRDPRLPVIFSSRGAVPVTIVSGGTPRTFFLFNTSAGSATLARVVTLGGCDRVFEGVAPGRYSVVVTGDGVLGMQSVEVRAQEIATAHVIRR
jgi:hypothetical protein